MQACETRRPPCNKLTQVHSVLRGPLTLAAPLCSCLRRYDLTGCSDALGISILSLNSSQEKHRTLEHVFEALLYKLMRSADKIESIDVIELCCDLASEKPACSSWRDGPCLYVFGIAPHEITEGALMRNLTHSLNCPYLHIHMSFQTCITIGLCSDPGPKQPTRSARRNRPCLYVFRIAPRVPQKGPLL